MDFGPSELKPTVVSQPTLSSDSDSTTKNNDDQQVAFDFIVQVDDGQSESSHGRLENKKFEVGFAEYFHVSVEEQDQEE